MLRTGLGYDAHKLVTNRPLILGGIKIEHPTGLLGHSDADVLVHAIMDALLGAVAAGSIGDFFPDTDAQYKNISSLKLLGKIKNFLDEGGWQINNIDAVIIAQNPKLAPFITQMRENIANILHLNLDQVGLKATTTERLGFTGREEGIAAQAVVLLNKNDN